MQVKKLTKFPIFQHTRMGDLNYLTKYYHLHRWEGHDGPVATYNERKDDHDGILIAPRIVTQPQRDPICKHFSCTLMSGFVWLRLRGLFKFSLWRFIWAIRKHFLSIPRGVTFLLNQLDAYVNSIIHCVLRALEQGVCSNFSLWHFSTLHTAITQHQPGERTPSKLLGQPRCEPAHKSWSFILIVIEWRRE